MKAILLALFALLQLYMSVQALNMDEMTAIFGRCTAETGATEADVQNFLKFNLATSRADKCMRACFMKAIGKLNENGKYVREVGYAISRFVAQGDSNVEKLLIESVDSCVDIDVPADHCEAAEAYNECLRRVSLEKGVSFAVI